MYWGVACAQLIHQVLAWSLGPLRTIYYCYMVTPPPPPHCRFQFEEQNVCLCQVHQTRQCRLLLEWTPPWKHDAFLWVSGKCQPFSKRKCDRSVALSPPGNADILTAHCRTLKCLRHYSLLLNYVQILLLKWLIKRHSYQDITTSLIFWEVYFKIFGVLYDAISVQLVSLVFYVF